MNREMLVDQKVRAAARMVAWFRARYEDPAENAPYDDGYVYLCGGPYDAREELSDNFPAEPGLSGDEWEEIIDAVVGEIEEDGSSEWAKISRENASGDQP